MFVDDTTLFASACDDGYLVDIFICELEKVSHWTKTNYLSLNVDKTFATVFSTRNINHIVNQHVVFDGQVVKSLTLGKFLGLIISDGLGFRGHIDYVCQKNPRQWEYFTN